MMKQIFQTNIVAMALLLASATAMACSSMGPNTHVGDIVSVDNKAKTLTIQDAETNKPITFEVSDKMLLNLAGIAGQVVVRYSGEGDKLIATNVE